MNLHTKCTLCHVPYSTGSCQHLLDLGDGRVVISRTVWEELVADRHRLRNLEQDYCDVKHCDNEAEYGAVIYHAGLRFEVDLCDTHMGAMLLNDANDVSTNPPDV